MTRAQQNVIEFAFSCFSPPPPFLLHPVALKSQEPVEARGETAN